MKTKKQNKKGISLIVLTITIIIMIILAGTVIITLMGQDIIERAETTVNNLDVAEVQSLAELKWSDAYIAGKRTNEELTQAVIEALKKELGEEVVAKYLIVANDEGVDVYGSPWIVDVVDTVPIPKGFVASSVEGENIKNTGLVIYEGTEPVTDANHYEALRTRNQYVWVPVEDFSKFVRQNFGKYYTISNTLGTDYWEVVLDTATNMPILPQDMNYMTSTTLEEVLAMYESVKEYKGFYIARYETGRGTQNSVMGAIPYNYVPWHEMRDETPVPTKIARKMYPATNINYGVVSTLTYGVQWDRTVAWWVEVKAQNATKTVTISSNDNLNNSTSYGNYQNSVIAAGDLNDGAKYAVYDRSSGEWNLGSYQSATTSSTKASGTRWVLTTGALKTASVNNIYDMAGNMWEWTMENGSSSSHVRRGGSCNYGYLVERETAGSSNYGAYDYGFRSTLYIKK